MPTPTDETGSTSGDATSGTGAETGDPGSTEGEDTGDDVECTPEGPEVVVEVGDSPPPLGTPDDDSTSGVVLVFFRAGPLSEYDATRTEFDACTLSVFTVEDQPPTPGEDVDHGPIRVRTSRVDAAMEVASNDYYILSAEEGLWGPEGGAMASLEFVGSDHLEPLTIEFVEPPTLAVSVPSEFAPGVPLEFTWAPTDTPHDVEVQIDEWEPLDDEPPTFATLRCRAPADAGSIVVSAEAVDAFLDAADPATENFVVTPVVRTRNTLCHDGRNVQVEVDSAPRPVPGQDYLLPRVD